MTNIVDLLDVLAPNTWTGNGFNLIAVPDKGQALGFRLIPNPTSETLTFSAVKPDPEDRGAGNTVILPTAVYRQTIKDLRDNSVIHDEPGLWGHAPKTDGKPDTFFRLASTPHGDCFLAQSTFFGPVSQELEIDHVSTNTFPFPQTDPIPDLNADPANPLGGQYVSRYSPKALPAGLPVGLDPARTFKDPTEVLRANIRNQKGEGQTIIETDVIVISTKPTQPTGILTIPAARKTPPAVQMDAILWVENVKDGASGQSFFQLQYLQRVILDFPSDGEDIHWPHVSVATLKLDDKKTGLQFP